MISDVVLKQRLLCTKTRAPSEGVETQEGLIELMVGVF